LRSKFGVLLAVLVAVSCTALAYKLWPKVFGSRTVLEEEDEADVDFPTVVRVKGGMLEVATVRGRKNFGGATDPTVLGIPIPYCRERAGWNVNYSVTYRIRLRERWPIRYRSVGIGEIYAQVPELEPSLPVAIDTSSLVRSASEKCWFMLPMNTRDRVLKRMSADLRSLAQSDRTKRFAREKARQTVTEFLRTWALNQTDPRVSPGAKIHVFFPGE
jgi:hypothetical protein